MKWSIICILIGFTTNLNYADEIILNNQVKKQGIIISQDNQNVYLEFEEKIIPISKSDIFYCHYDLDLPSNSQAKELYYFRRAQISTSNYPAKLKLAEFCMDNQLYKEAQSEIRSLISVLPNHTQQLEQWLNMIDEKEAQNKFTQVLWWKNDANQLDYALKLCEDILIQHPSSQMIPTVQKEISILQKQMKQLQKIKILFHASPNIVYSPIQIFFSNSMDERTIPINLKLLIPFLENKIEKQFFKNTPIQIFILNNIDEYKTTSNHLEWSHGHTEHFLRKNSQGLIEVYLHKIYLINDIHLKESFIHEIVHVLNRQYFPPQLKIPQWFDEGFAMLLSDQYLNNKLQSHINKNQKWLPLELLLQATDYPVFESIFYQQSFLFVQFICEYFSIKTLLKFTFALSKSISLNKSINYALSPDADNIKDLELIWSTWVKKVFDI